MVLDVRLRPADLRDLLLRSGRDVLVHLQLRDARLAGLGDVPVRGVLAG